MPALASDAKVVYKKVEECPYGRAGECIDKKKGIRRRGTTSSGHLEAAFGGSPCGTNWSRCRRSVLAGRAVSNVARDLARLDPSLTVRAVGAYGGRRWRPDRKGALRLHTSTSPTSSAKARSSFTDVLYSRDQGAQLPVFSRRRRRVHVKDVPLDELNCKILHAGYILLLPAQDAPDRSTAPAWRGSCTSQARGICQRGRGQRGGRPLPRHRAPALRYTITSRQRDRGRKTGACRSGAGRALLIDRIRRS